ncbi:MAG: hypothetical protein N3I35_13550 [Clostridia bacterium]|nr:hypothetical protein [Clostridia bacterium]
MGEDRHIYLEEINVTDVRSMACKDSDEIIDVCGNKYMLNINENGEISIKRYNEKYKMWVRIIFSKNPGEYDPAGFIKEILIKQYIDRVVGTD